ncbi:MAG: hypothetical protein IJT73_09480, partial [Selenomonadaceae bacterium]|nr:hypothetical protein [Selenomonadaceae bacterium]
MISAKDFIHEQDAALTKKIFAETPFKSLMDRLHENNFDAVSDYVCSASFVEIQQPELIKMREIACQKFNIKNFPMCSTRDYNFEISTFGYNSPAILIPNSLLQSASEDILQARIYASAAALAAGQHKLIFFIWAAENMSGIAGLPVIGQALSALLYEWNRVRQFSLDRAVFLATGDINLSFKN